MTRADFVRQPRDGRLFDVWTSRAPVATSIGPLPLELHVKRDAAPGDAMIEAAGALAAHASAHGETILDLVFAHYRRAESRNWLGFWSVPAGLRRDEVLGQVDGMAL